ncbi:MAG: hypothetical protein U0Q12_22025 [Vicinamibacterales bacterium]
MAGLHGRRVGGAFIVLVALALSTTACGRDAARELLDAAERALTAARPVAEAYAPDELSRLATRLDDAKRRFAAGDYAQALAMARQLPDDLQALQVSAAARKDRLLATWATLERAVPERIASVQADVARMAEAKALSATSRETLELLGAKADALRAAWDEAARLFAEGEVMRALERAGALESRAEELREQLPASASRTR